MTTRRRTSKRTWMEETARVMAIARAIDEELRALYPPVMVISSETLLEVADRIASRTEE